MNIPSGSNKVVDANSLTIHQAKNIDNISHAICSQYDHIVGEIIDDFNFKGVGLFLTVTCRNTFTNTLFTPISRMMLLKDMNSRGECAKSIKVDRSQYKIVKSLQDILKVNVDIAGNKPNMVWTSIGILLNISKSAYMALNDWFWYRVFRLKKVPTRPITYVDTFLYIDSISKEEMQDRNYTGFDSFLTGEELEDIWFAPTVYGIRFPSQYKEMCSNIKANGGNILLQESWLSAYDYLVAFISSIFVPIWFFLASFRINSCYSGLVRASMITDIGSPALMLAFYRFLFIRRLSKHDIKIRGVVDWNENQTIDRALSLSIRKYYPDVLIRGYQGFPVKEYNPAYSPTCKEVFLGTIPHEMHVISQAHIKEKKASCPELKTYASGAFRYSYLRQFSNKRINGESHVFFALPLVEEECEELMRHAIELKEALKHRVVVRLKYHPAYTVNEERLEELLELGVEVTYEPSISLLEKSSLLVTSESGVAVEAVSLGVPVAIHGNEQGMTFNPLSGIKHNTISIKYYHIDELVAFSKKCANYNLRDSCIDSQFFDANRESALRLFVF